MSGNLAGQIDSFLKSYGGSPLVGLGSTFVAAGRKYGVDPRLIVGIAGAESSFGKYVPANSHNAWGWGPGIPFGSWQEGISKVAQGLQSGYLSQGLTTPAKIAPKWAPASDGNDPAHWSQTVAGFMQQMGASPAASMAMTVTAPAGTSEKKNTGAAMSAVPSSSGVPSPGNVLGALLPALTQQPSNYGTEMAALGSLQQISQTGHADPVGMLQNMAWGGFQDAQMTNQNQTLALMEGLSSLEQGTPGQSTGNTPPSVTQPSVTPTPSKVPSSTTVWPYASDVQKGRTDQGIDWIQSSQYLAPKSGTIASIDRNWYKGTPSVYLKFDQPVTVNGRTYPGVYFAETSVIPGMKVGDRVEAGQPIAGGSPGGGLAEQGFAAPTKEGNWLQAAYGQYTEGKPTQAGQDFLDWLGTIRK